MTSNIWIGVEYICDCALPFFNWLYRIILQFLDTAISMRCSRSISTISVSPIFPINFWYTWINIAYAYVYSTLKLEQHILLSANRVILQVWTLSFYSILWRMKNEWCVRPLVFSYCQQKFKNSLNNFLSIAVYHLNAVYVSLNRGGANEKFNWNAQQFNLHARWLSCLMADCGLRSSWLFVYISPWSIFSWLQSKQIMF